MNIISRTRKVKGGSAFEYVGLLVVFTAVIQNGCAVIVEYNKLDNNEISKYS